MNRQCYFICTKAVFISYFLLNVVIYFSKILVFILNSFIIFSSTSYIVFSIFVNFILNAFNFIVDLFDFSYYNDFMLFDFY
jgi:hypothetical protein